MSSEWGRSFLEFPFDRLDAFKDRLTFRDPRGRSRRPALADDARGILRALDRFLIVHEYRVTKPDAIRFLEVTRDENPIHVQDEIVPGALTLSKTVFPLEALLDGFSVDGVRAKFTGASFYGHRTVNHFFLSPGPGPGEVAVEVNTYQSGRIIAKTSIRGAFGRTENAPAGEVHGAPRENLELLHTFCESLGIDPVFYREGPLLRRASFPRAFLASLPSGEMVRQFKGKGGMLNVLSLDFSPPSYPIAAERFPEVQVEQGRTGPRMFNRVLTRIIDGFRTYGRGFALVHRPV